jgi:hypothetical protein
MADRSTLILATAAGITTGALAWFALKPIVDRQIASSVRTQLETQIPQQLERELDAKLRAYGITPQATTALSQLLSAAGRSGVF